MNNTIYIDIEKTFGTNFVLKGIFDWLDFNDKTKILGTKFVVFAINENNQLKEITVKIKKPKAEIDEISSLVPLQPIYFENLVGTVYFMNDKMGASLSADDITTFKMRGN